MKWLKAVGIAVVAAAGFWFGALFASRRPSTEGFKREEEAVDDEAKAKTQAAEAKRAQQRAELERLQASKAAEMAGDNAGRTDWLTKLSDKS